MRMVLMYHGHDPREIDDYSLADCKRFMRALPTLNAMDWAGMGGLDG